MEKINPPSRFLPNSFDPNDPMLATIEMPPLWSWESCESALAQFGSRGVMSRLPLWWQLESPLHAACTSVGAFLYLADAANMPISGAAVLRADIDTILTTGDDAHAFVRYLMEKSVPLPRSWIIVHPLRKKPLPDPLRRGSFQIAEEVHASPGIISYA